MFLMKQQIKGVIIMLDLKVGEIVEVWSGDELVDGNAKVISIGADGRFGVEYVSRGELDTWWFTKGGKWDGRLKNHYLKKKEPKPYAPEFKVGDKVYCLAYGKGEVVGNESVVKHLPVQVVHGPRRHNTYTVDGKLDRYHIASLFHLGAVTFDALGRPVAIDWNYKPSREEKKVITKLPHEFKKDEDILYAVYSEKVWGRAKFVRVGASRRYLIRDSRIQRSHDGSGNLLPYKGNEHMEGAKFTDDKLGAFPEGYVIPDGRVIPDVPKKPKIKKPKLKFGKACLCRDSVTENWRLKTFVAKMLEATEFPYLTANGCFSHCIPYKGNEYLEGTSESPDAK